MRTLISYSLIWDYLGASYKQLPNRALFKSSFVISLILHEIDVTMVEHIFVTGDTTRRRVVGVVRPYIQPLHGHTFRPYVCEAGTTHFKTRYVGSIIIELRIKCLLIKFLSMQFVLRLRDNRRAHL